MNAVAVINIARQQLAMEESAYRDLLMRVAGVASLRAMSEKQLAAVLKEMTRLGFKKTSGSKKLPAATKPYIRLIHALWKSCHSKGVVQDGSRPALRAFVKKRCGVDDPDFLTYAQATPIIDALKAMEARGKWTRRNRQSHRAKVRLPFETLTDLAPSITPLHGPMVSDGYDLQASSAIHRTSKGTLTARLVYRPRSNVDAVQSLVITVRNIRLDSDILSEQKPMRKR